MKKESSGIDLSLSEISENLNTDTFGKSVVVLGEVGSTNLYAKGLLDIFDDGTLIVANTQSNGRGRLGKTFISPYGGLYMSIVFKVGQTINEPDFITVKTALCVIHAIEKLTDICGLGIKWVNDIYCGDKKVCGILAERISEKNKQDYIILGIGVNVETKNVYFTGDAKNIATSLSEHTDKYINKNILCAEIVNELEKYLFKKKISRKKIIDEYRNRSILINKDIYVIKGENEIPAKVIGIDDNASLYVNYENGTSEILRTGEVSTKLKAHESEAK